MSQPTPSGTLTPVASSPALVSLPRPTLPQAAQASLPKIPSISPQLPLPSLPQVKLPTAPTLPTVGTMTPALPRIVIPTLSGFGAPGRYVTPLLPDNELGELQWNRPNPPHPENTNSLYRRVGCIGDGSCLFHALAKALSETYRMSYTEFRTIDEGMLQTFENSVGGKIRFPDSLFDRPRIADMKVIYTIRTPPRYKENMLLQFNQLMLQFRLLYAKLFREDFAMKVSQEPKMNDLIKKRLPARLERPYHEPSTHKLVAGSADPAGTSMALAKQLLIEELLSGEAVEPDFLLLISDYLNVDIYLLRDRDLINPDPKNTPLYGGSSIHETVHGPSDMRTTREPDRNAIVIISKGDNHYELVGRVDQTITDQKTTRTTELKFTQTEPLIRRLFEMLKIAREKQ